MLPFHDYVTLSFRTVKDAAAAVASLRRLSPTFEVAPGDHQIVIVSRCSPRTCAVVTTASNRCSMSALRARWLSPSIALGGGLPTAPLSGATMARRLTSPAFFPTRLWGQESQDLLAAALQVDRCQLVVSLRPPRLFIPVGLRPPHRYRVCHHTDFGVLQMPCLLDSLRCPGTPRPCSEGALRMWQAP